MSRLPRIIAYSDDWAHSVSIVFRMGSMGGPEAKGLMFKWVRKPNGLDFSEREKCYRHAWQVGKLYVRTFARKPSIMGRE